MSISGSRKPYNAVWVSTPWAVCAIATLTIWNPDPRLAWGFEAAMFVLAALACVRSRLRAHPAVVAAVAGIGLYGFAQLLAGATVYRWATLNAGLAYLALAATAIAGYAAFETESARVLFRRALVWFGVSLSVLGVLCYLTSPGKILWVFPSPYPDTWGPFLSRNNFAQFLQLCLPVALYEMASTGGSWPAALAAAVMLAAGLASASRAGAVLLVAEALAALFLLRRKLRGKPGRAGFNRVALVRFAAAAVAFTLLAGAGTLAGRLAQPDPLSGRRDIFRSAVAMIAARPLLGYGLGTFSTVYPEFAEFDAGARVEHAHNDWLEWAAEGGLPFAALWGVLALASVRPAVRTVWGLGVPTLFLHALVDYPYARFGVAAWAFLLSAAMFRRGEKTPEPKLLTQGRSSVKLPTVQSAIAFGLALCMGLAASGDLPAAATAIGTIEAKGSFRVDDATVGGNATLFEGATVETRLTGSVLDLSAGPRISLSADSKGRIFGDHLVLEKGSGKMEKAAGFRMEARGLTIRPETGTASARVTLAGNARVQVAALAGSLRVLTARGLLVAAMAPGAALEFAPQAASAGGEPWKLTGCLRTIAGHFLLTDEVTNVTVELAGAGIEAESGNRVEVTGALDAAATPVSGATQFIRVSRVKRLGKGCAEGKGAAAAGAGGAAGKAAGVGIAGISATTIAIVGGVAVAATVGGLAAASGLPGQGGGGGTVSR
jgi:O-antigen ligase